MIELLKSLYDQNEQYHEVKERMAWQALAIYLGFSFLLMNWLYVNAKSWIALRWCIYPIMLPVLLSTSVPAFFFVRKQIWLKALSARKSEIYLNFMMDHPEPTEKQFYRCVQDIKKSDEEVSYFDSRGWPGWWALIAISFFFVIQIMLACLLVLEVLPVPLN